MPMITPVIPSNDYATGGGGSSGDAYSTGNRDAPARGSAGSLPKIIDVKTISIKHPDYIKYHAMWDKLRILYNGPPEVINAVTSLLVARPNEPTDVYSKRQARLVYTNVLETIITWFAAFLLKSVIDIDIFETDEQRRVSTLAATSKSGKPKPSKVVPIDSSSLDKSVSIGNILAPDDPRTIYYSTFRSDVDRAGTNWTMFWREVLSKTLTYGTFYILTDKERIAPEDAVTKKQSDALGGDKPYFIQYSPLSVTNWRLDKYGRLDWAVIEQIVTHQPTPFEESIELREWWYYDTKQWAQYQEVPLKTGESDQQARLVGSGNHALSNYKNSDGSLGKVPLERLSLHEGLWFGRRIMLPCLNYLNAENELAWLLMQCYVPIPVITGSSNIVDGGSDYGQNKFGPNVSEASALLLPAGATFGWSQPEATSASIGLNRLSELLENIYRLLYLQDQGRPSGATSASQSGYALMLTKMPSREISRALGGKIQNYMSVMLRNVAVARNEDLSFGVRGLTFNEDTSLLALDETQRLKNLGIPSVTWIREALKNLARSTRAFEDASDAVLTQVEAEIDKFITEEFMTNWVNALWNNIPLAPNPNGLESTAGSNIPGRPNGQILGPDGRPMPQSTQPGSASPVIKSQPTSPSIPYQIESSLIRSS